MAEAFPVVLLILTLIAASALLANRLGVSAPVLQTAIGIALSFIPHFPHIELEPRFVLLVILPPLVYTAAVELPWNEFRDNLRPISALAFGLVTATTAAVAGVAHAFLHLGWAEAVILGAVVSPTDPVATTAIASRLGVPRRLIAIVEGEGLVNDAVALTLYRLAVGAAVAGAFSLGGGLTRFVAIVVGEIAYGVFIGWLAALIRERITDPKVEVTVSFLTPFAAYLVPEILGGSGVLATVAAGMYIGERTPELVPSGTRLHLTGVWEMIVFVLNGGLFLLTGLQLRTVWAEDAAHSPESHFFYAGIIAATVILTRFAWVWPAAWISAAISRRRKPNSIRPNSHLAFVGWSGMRGGISLAAALSIPFSVENRLLMLFLTAAVIAVTLLLQGLTLPYVIRWLRLDREAEIERAAEQEREAAARLRCIEAGMQAIATKSGQAADLLRAEYRFQSETLHATHKEDKRFRKTSDVDLLRTALDAERRCAIDMKKNGSISEHTLHAIEREIDLKEALMPSDLL